MFRSLGYNWGCTKQGVLSEALRINDINFLVNEIEYNKDLYWRKEVLAEALVTMLKATGLKPQQLVKMYLSLVGAESLEALNRIFNKRTITAMLDKQDILSKSCSRLREDDREMLYWVEVRLAQPLDKALHE
jgi:hypothetical protein